MSTRTSYQYRSSSIPRAGSYERTVCYSLPTSTRNFDFQNPRKINSTITGREIKHFKQTPSKEITPFTQRNLHPQPDSNRTLNPNLAPEPDKRAPRSNSMASFRFNTDSSQFNYISDVNDTLPKRRPCNPKVYQSFQLSDQLKPAPYHRLIKPALFKKYDTTSQIKYLPGCIKRDNNEINDNINMSKKPTKKRRESYQSKVQHDYRSNVACLPGSAINEMKIEPKSKRTSVKNTSHDIFNINAYDSATTPNTFNTSQRRKYANTTKNLFGESNSSINYTKPTTGIRRSENRNRSQFEFI